LSPSFGLPTVAGVLENGIIEKFRGPISIFLRRTDFERFESPNLNAELSILNNSSIGFS
jgi:hypothetical protein